MCQGSSSLWCKMHAGGLSQQLTALTGRISTSSMWAKASTTNETLGVVFSLWCPAPSFGCLSSPLQSVGISLQQVLMSHLHSLTSLSRNCAMFKMVGAGRQIRGLEVSTIQCHAANSLHTSVHTATLLQSVRGWTSSCHSISSSSILFLHCSSHLLVLHMGLTICEGGDDVS